MRYLEQYIPAAYEISNIPVNTKRPRAKHTPSHDETTMEFMLSYHWGDLSKGAQSSQYFSTKKSPIIMSHFGDFFPGIESALGDEVATSELKLFDGIIQRPEALRRMTRVE